LTRVKLKKLKLNSYNARDNKIQLSVLKIYLNRMNFKAMQKNESIGTIILCFLSVLFTLYQGV